MKYLKASVVAMLVVAVALTVCSFAGINGFYRHPVFLALVLLFLAIQVLCIMKYRAKLSVHSIGFYLCHVGVLFIAVGAVLGMFAAESVTFNIPVGEHTTYREAVLEDGSVIDFGFSIAVTSFRVETYENSEDVKQYEANLRIYDKDSTKERTLSINSPAKYNGWAFYIMGYDTGTVSYVSMHAKNDPGNIFLLIGFIAVDIGTAVLCFSALGRKNQKGGKRNDL